MNDLSNALIDKGIAALVRPYSDRELVKLNDVLDRLFEPKRNEARTYVTISEMAENNILGDILDGGMKDIILSILPDPVLFHCHAYEIAGDATRSHVFGESLNGWHRDYDSEYHSNKATHVSIFVYLSGVGSQNGPFEFCMESPGLWLSKSAETVAVLGDAGFCFAWNRAFYHRANPNRASSRRRVLKISVQPRQSANSHISNAVFSRTREIVPAGDPYLDSILNRPKASAVALFRNEVPATRMASNGRIGLSNQVIFNGLKDHAVRNFKHRLKYFWRKAPPIGVD